MTDQELKDKKETEVLIDCAFVGSAIVLIITILYAVV